MKRSASEPGLSVTECCVVLLFNKQEYLPFLLIKQSHMFNKREVPPFLLNKQPFLLNKPKITTF